MTNVSRDKATITSWLVAGGELMDDTSVEMYVVGLIIQYETVSSVARSPI
jgi:hypothetical protein